MLTNTFIRKITIATCALLIVLILYTFPKKKETIDYEQSYNYVENLDKKNNIFLIDENNYVAMTNIMLSTKNSVKKCKELLQTLIIGSKKSNYIPNGFKAIIPKKTTINNLDLNEGLLKVDFSKEILNVSLEEEEKMIEAIVYTLTSVDGVEKVMIFCEGKILSELPNSGKILPQTLDRSYGINKVYDLDSLEGTSKTTVYYISKFNENYYYVPITKINNDNTNKVEIIINELKSSPIYQTNLMSYLKANVELKEYELKENTISLSFNENLFNDLNSKDILEEVKYTISLSLKDNFDVDEVIFLVNDEKVANLTLKNVE